MMHLRPFDSEPERFRKMEEYAHASGFARVSHVHREIYLSDPRRIVPDIYNIRLSLTGK
jgi:hypothetical protein